MANTKQARKRARQTVARNQHMTSLQSAARTAIKTVRKAIAAGDKDAALKCLQAQMSTIDSMTRKGAMHKNAAARNKARLAAAIKAM